MPLCWVVGACCQLARCPLDFQAQPHAVPHCAATARKHLHPGWSALSICAALGLAWPCEGSPHLCMSCVYGSFFCEPPLVFVSWFQSLSSQLYLISGADEAPSGRRH